MTKKTNNNNNKFNFAKNVGGNILIWLLIIAMSITALQILSSDNKPVPISHTQYLSLLNNGQIESATITGKEFTGKLFAADSLVNKITKNTDYNSFFVNILPYEVSHKDEEKWEKNNILITANEPTASFFDYIIQYLGNISKTCIITQFYHSCFAIILSRRRNTRRKWPAAQMPAVIS